MYTLMCVAYTLVVRNAHTNVFIYKYKNTIMYVYKRTLAKPAYQLRSHVMRLLCNSRGFRVGNKY